MAICRFYQQGYCRNGSTKVAFFLFFFSVDAWSLRDSPAIGISRRPHLLPITRRHGIPTSPIFMPNQTRDSRLIAILSKLQMPANSNTPEGASSNSSSSSKVATTALARSPAASPTKR